MMSYGSWQEILFPSLPMCCVDALNLKSRDAADCNRDGKSHWDSAFDIDFKDLSRIFFARFFLSFVMVEEEWKCKKPYKLNQLGLIRGGEWKKSLAKQHKSCDISGDKNFLLKTRKVVNVVVVQWSFGMEIFTHAAPPEAVSWGARLKLCVGGNPP